MMNSPSTAVLQTKGGSTWKGIGGRNDRIYLSAVSSNSQKSSEGTEWSRIEPPAFVWLYFQWSPPPAIFGRLGCRPVRNARLLYTGLD